MNKKRILLVSHYLGVTGAPASLLRHAKYMLEAGCHVEVWSIDVATNNGLEEAYRLAGLEVRHIANNDEAITATIRETYLQYDLAVCNTVCTYKCVRVFQSMGIPTVWFIRETVVADRWAVDNIEFCNLFKRFYNLYCRA